MRLVISACVSPDVSATLNSVNDREFLLLLGILFRQSNILKRPGDSPLPATGCCRALSELYE